ncbi:MAG: XisI protein [Blastocatellia bacterium]
MDKIEEYRQIVRRILTEHTKIPFSNSNAQFETVFDREADRYLVMILGYENDRRRVHGCLIHVDIIDGKIWIQRDGTEYGVGNELVDAGIPKDKIVLGFKSPEFRKYTEFAAA